MNRRLLLKYGIFGSATLLCGGLFVGLQSSAEHAPQQSLRLFSPKEYSILYAIANCIIPETTEFPSICELQIVEKIDLLLSNAHPEVQQEIQMGLQLLENALTNGIFQGKFRPFSQLSIEEQTLCLEDWRLSSLHVRRTLFGVFNGLCQSAYYANISVHHLVGYDGPPQYLLDMVRTAQYQALP